MIDDGTLPPEHINMSARPGIEQADPQPDDAS
jgi:hypothetical protein